MASSANASCIESSAAKTRMSKDEVVSAPYAGANRHRCNARIEQRACLFMTTGPNRGCKVDTEEDRSVPVFDHKPSPQPRASRRAGGEPVNLPHFGGGTGSPFLHNGRSGVCPQDVLVAGKIRMVKVGWVARSGLWTRAGLANHEFCREPDVHGA